MKSIIVYYSLDGNTDMVAQKISKRIGADLLKIRPVKDWNKDGMTKYFWGGRSAWMKEKPQLESYDFEVDKYDLIIIGTPIWAWTMTPPIRTFLSDNKISDKKVILFCAYDGDFGKVFADMKGLMGKNEYLGEAGFKGCLKNMEVVSNQIDDFVEEMGINKKYIN